MQGCANRSTAVNPSLIRHSLDHIQMMLSVLGPQYEKDVDKLGWVQRRVTKMAKGWRPLLCEVVDGGRLRDNGHKLKQKRFRLDKRKLFHDDNSWAVKVAAQRLYTVHSPSLEVFKSRLDKALTQAGLMSYLNLLWAGGCTRDLQQLLPTQFALWSCFPHNT